MMPTLYLPTDAGVPTLTYSVGGALSRFTSTKTLLKACLVTGYGSKPAAGWSLVDEGDTFIVLRNSTGYYVTLVSMSAYLGGSSYYPQMRIYLHATYTGMSGNVPQGMGVVTGTTAGNATPHWWGSTNLWYSANTSKWLLVADDRTFILTTISAGTSNASAIGGASFDTNYSPVPGSATLYVGEDLGGNFIAAGGRVDTTYTTHMMFSHATFTTLYNPASGLLVDTGGVVATLRGMYGNVLGVTSKMDMAELELGLVRWVCADAAQPGLRGIRRDALLGTYNTFAAKNSIENTNLTHDCSNILVPLELSDGYIYQPLMAYQQERCQAFITNNPGCW